MKIELKNIKHQPSMSEETECYQASLYVDGVKIGTVSNRGTGGPDHFQGDQDAYAKANEWCKANLPPYTLEYGEGTDTLPTDLEMHCGDLLEAYIMTKQLKALLKKMALFTVPNEKGIFQSKYKGKQAPDERLFDHIRQKHNGAIILNTLPLSEALATFKSHSA